MQYTLTFSMLSVTYVITSHPIPVCYRQHVLPCLVISPSAISDICHCSFVSLNFAGLLSIETRISTQLSMTSRSENEAVND